MNQKQSTLVAVIAAGITAILLLVMFLFSFGQDTGETAIVLPQDQTQPTAPVTQSVSGVMADPDDQTPLEVTRDNVKKLVAGLKRPSQYSCTTLQTVMWGNEAAATKRQEFVLNDYMRIVRYRQDGAVEGHEILGPDTVFTWEDKSTQVKSMARGDYPLDVAARRPTYEDVLSLPDANIIAAAYTLMENRPCIWIQTTDNEAYETDYWIDVENGLLLYADSRENGLSAWQFEMTEFSPETPSDEWFKLPTGASAMDAQEAWNNTNSQ